MRLGKKIKFNMIIAILLCMAFVVNIGATFAATTYSLLAKSSVNATSNETYIEYANATGSTGKYYYSIGSYNNQLSINYGFSSGHDLMVKFTATYTDPTHKANDFSLNFVDRDMWCIDMLTVTSPVLEDDNGDEYTNTFYGLTANTFTISGVMYYMKSLDGSGTLPIISGVTFYTSPNNSYTNIGDELTITLTPTYVKSSEYDVEKHAFKDLLLNNANGNVAFSNWIKYMGKTNQSLQAPIVMTYNAYANSTYALQYPSDYNWAAGNFNLVGQTEPEYSNTAYRYSVDYEAELKNSSYQYSINRDYSAVIAGNKYYGGAGVYVIPGANTTNHVHITITYAWQKNNAIDNVGTNVVQLGWSNHIKTIGTVNYSIMAISKPTYINVLDYIMLTAEDPYTTLLKQGYGLVITGITASSVAAPNGLASSSKTNYEIINATEQSPSLIRVKDVIKSSKTLSTNVSVVNNSNSDMAITGFTVKAKMWYSTYKSGKDENDNPVVSAWKDMLFNEILEEPKEGEDAPTYKYLPLLKLKTNTEDYVGFDESDWSLDSVTPVSYLDTDDIEGTDTVQFNFNANSEVCIAPGYAIQIINSVMIPQQYDPKAEDFELTGGNDANGNPAYETISMYDMWCSLEVEISTSGASYSETEGYGGIETTTDGYYSFVNSGTDINIYVRNNTSQNITSVSLAELVLATINTSSSATLIDRDKMSVAQNFQYIVKYFDGQTGTYYTNPGSGQSGFAATECETIIRPNETILLCTITDIQDTDHTKYIINSYKVDVDFAAGSESSDVDLIKNIHSSSADLVNDSQKYYEFRIVSSSDISAKVINYNADSSKSEYVLEKIDNNNKYYYYYKGVICPDQCIAILDGLNDISGIDVEFIEHKANGNDKYYEASNYSEWNTESELSADWLNAMKSIYSIPNFTDAQ